MAVFTKSMRAIILLVAVFSPAATALDQDTSEALLADDACVEGDDAACSLSLRQLRGEQTMAAVSSHKHQKANTTEEEEMGFCCYSGSGGDPCTSCYSTAMAASGEFCDSSSKCGGCGGTWCAAFCCHSAADAGDVCGTCYPTAVAEAGTFCAGSRANCNSCSGATVCGKPSKPAAAEAPAAAETPPAAEAPAAADDDATEAPAAAEEAA